MAAKEKAIGLYDKYATYAVMWAGDSKTTKENCKQCALICVDEIIKATSLTCMSELEAKEYKYWQEVKQEINKL